MGPGTDFHHPAEARSFALHEEVAKRISERPDLVERARQRVSVWLEDPTRHPYAGDWMALLVGPRGELLDALTSRHERMCTLRQASPFAGALDNRTRWQILKRTGSSRSEAS
jgi:hypothetical protein